MRSAHTPWWKRIGLMILIVIGILVLAGVALIVALVVTEYNPPEREDIAIEGSTSKELMPGDTLSMISWNIGYCGLGEEEDFFMDGGEEVFPSSQAQVEENLSAMENYLAQQNADVVFLQEVDQNATRTGYLDEVASFRNHLENYCSSFANNFKVLFVPYPIPPMGHEDAGILTFSKYNITESTRVQLPCPFTGIEKIGNLKRCLLISRVPLANCDKELVLINLHLEAYDSGEGKIAQTKMLMEEMEAEYAKGNYVIVAGDFNQVFDNIDTSMYPMLSEDVWVPGAVETQAFGDHWQFLMDTDTPSCRSLDAPYVRGASPEEFQYFMLDGYILSDNLSLEHIETLDLGFEHSDHNPVAVTVVLSENE
ncbi:MAG: endonuclease/exonuclease/phosphatase family protein [Lachnospiraceae bacterium]|nr:endonuclease/exonuclease/phosphatase family protein [Lachnospiraceae bacterium]